LPKCEEQYRYHALGRRVWRRATNGWRGEVRDTLCTRPAPSTECQSFVERTVWDGDQILYEIRAQLEPGDPTSAGETDTPQSLHFNRAVYTHAGGIDNPIEILWLGDFQIVPLAPHTDWRGSFIAATGEPELTFTSGSEALMDKAPGDVWRQYMSVAHLTADGELPLPSTGVYRGSLATKAGYVLPETLLEAMREWLESHGQENIYYFLTETFSSLAGQDTFALHTSELTEELLASLNPGVESVLTAPGFEWAIGMDHDGFLHVVGPESLYGRVREWRDRTAETEP
jgi:hypothetical protein